MPKLIHSQKVKCPVCRKELPIEYVACPDCGRENPQTRFAQKTVQVILRVDADLFEAVKQCSKRESKTVELVIAEALENFLNKRKGVI